MNGHPREHLQRTTISKGACRPLVVSFHYKPHFDSSCSCMISYYCYMTSYGIQDQCRSKCMYNARVLTTTVYSYGCSALSTLVSRAAYALIASRLSSRRAPGYLGLSHLVVRNPRPKPLAGSSEEAHPFNAEECSGEEATLCLYGCRMEAIAELAHLDSMCRQCSGRVTADPNS